MNRTSTAPAPSVAPSDYLLRYRPLAGGGAAAGYAFPCDCEGHVNLDALTERERNDYLYARAVVGRELDAPRVQPMVH